MLASGSDDFRVCLWKLGQAPNASDPVNDVRGVETCDLITDPAKVEGFWPGLGIGLQTIVHTGHTRLAIHPHYATVPHLSKEYIFGQVGASLQQFQAAQLRGRRKSQGLRHLSHRLPPSRPA
jgi:hypothetical protein